MRVCAFQIAFMIGFIMLDRKGDDIDRWLAGMRCFQNRLYPAGSTPADWLLG